MGVRKFDKLMQYGVHIEHAASEPNRSCRHKLRTWQFADNKNGYAFLPVISRLLVDGGRLTES